MTTSTENSVTLSVEGMTCGHCVGKVTAELTAITGVASASVDLDAAQATAVSDGTLDAEDLTEAMTAAITTAGYTAVGA